MSYLAAPKWASLDLLGIIIDGQHVPAFLALVGVIGAALIAAIPVVMKHKADKRTSVTTELRGYIEELRKDREEDRAKIKTLERDMQEFKLQKDLDRRTIDRLTDRVRDLEEENEDLWGYARAVIRWEDAGGTPPLPPQPWRIKDQLAQAGEGGLL